MPHETFNMLYKVLIISFSLCICYEIEEQKLCLRENKDKGIVSDLAHSFVRLKNKLSDFFKISTLKVEKRRRKIKTALHNFIEEALYNRENSSKLVALSVSNDEDMAKEAHMSSIQLITYHGYQAEAHTVQTRDGYMLILNRVLPATEKPLSPRNKVVIMHHGLMGSSDDWLLLGPSKAFPYLLSDAGYDVWLTNARGNKYSRFHIFHPENSSEFWDFSFHEMGTLDLPAVIDYVKDKSESDLIDFVGFSMGATALLVLLSELPQYNRVLKSATLLAPLAFMYQIKGPLKLLAKFHGENARNSLNFLGINEFMPIESFPVEVIDKYCLGGGRLCRNPLLLIANGGKEIKNEDILPNVLGHMPSGASMKTIMHYIQLINKGQFLMYDYDTLNFKAYKQRMPPEYNLKSVTLPVVLFSSYDDWLSTNANILRLLTVLPNVVVHHVVKKDDFTHTDFIWGEDAPKLLYSLAVGLLEQISQI